MLTWPHPRTDWAPILDAAEQVFCKIAHAVTQTEQCLIVCHDANHVAHVHSCLNKANVRPEKVALVIAESNDSWARDHGPITVLCRNEPLLLDFRFNGWGNKFPSDLDNKINRTLSRESIFGAYPMETVDLVLEGGSIEVDGSGTLLTTEACLLAATRNPALTKSELEHKLSAYLGINHFLWLKNGALAGDDTDSHIDTLARFCNPDTIAYSICNNNQDPNYHSLLNMEAELTAFRNARGEPYQLIPLPLPEPIHDENGSQLPATYANFLLINGAVLLPVYNDAADEIARQNLASVFPGRKIICINCLPLIEQHGSLHCVTMQLPQQLKVNQI